MTIIYTDSEATTKKYKVADAINAAKLVMFDRYSIKTLDESFLAYKGFKPETPVTLVELNNISDKLINDTKYFNKIRH